MTHPETPPEALAAVRAPHRVVIEDHLGNDPARHETTTAAVVGLELDAWRAFLRGETWVDLPLAERLAAAFGGTAAVWKAQQSAYDKHEAREAMREYAATPRRKVTP